MSTSVTGKRTFGQKLSAELGSRGMGANTLAKAISKQHGGKVEDRRRTIIRWLRGATPVARNREIVEDVLGMKRDSLKGDDEDEESDVASPFTLSVAIDYQLLAQALERRLLVESPRVNAETA
jgi:hypothetical protein